MVRSMLLPLSALRKYRRCNKGKVESGLVGCDVSVASPRLHPEDRGCRFLRNDGNHLQDNMASQPEEHN
jgi:hypothetical protein